MGNNLSSEYDRDLVIAALDAIPNMPSQQSPPSLVCRLPVDAVRSPQQSPPDTVSFDNHPMDNASDSRCNLPKVAAGSQATNPKEDATTAEEKNKELCWPLQELNEYCNLKQTLPSTKLLSSDPKVNNNNDLTLVPASPSISALRRPLESMSSTPLLQQFPLSPPCPSHTLSQSALEHKSPLESNESEIDDLPDIEHLIALTQPVHSPSSPRRGNKRIVSSMPYSSSRSPSPTVTVNGQMSDSSRIPNLTLLKKRRIYTESETSVESSDSSRIPNPTLMKKRRIYTEAETSVESKETSDASADEQLPKINEAPKLPAPLQSQRPTPKLKRKVSSHGTEMQTPTGHSRQASLSQSRAPKRAKTYQKHPVYWYLDGNVRIQIGNTCFQLHRSILVRQSKWFEKRFDTREIDNAEDSCDISDLDITAEDFEEVLHALEDTHACFQGELPFSKLNVLLRVSTALGFTTIERYASDALTTMWSASLADVGIDKTDHPTESLALARQCALFPVIKRTLYELLRLPNFGKTKVKPGDVSVVSMVCLGPYDIDLLIAAREHLAIAWREALDVDRFPTCVAQQSIVDGVGEPTEKIPACAATNHAFSIVAHHEIMKECDILGFEYDPVNGLQALAAAPWKEKGFCQACVEHRQTYWQKERERIWQKFDEWFEV